MGSHTKKCGDLRFFLFENLVFVKIVAPIARRSYLPCSICNIRNVTTLRCILNGAQCNVKEPATGRPYVRAFSLSGTVPASTCDCLRFVCAFTRRRKFDLCVSTSSRTMLAFGNNVSCSISACSTLASCRR